MLTVNYCGWPGISQLLRFRAYRIGSVPHRLRSRPPSAIDITTRISSGLGASATDTVIVSKCGNDQESSLCPSGTSRTAPHGCDCIVECLWRAVGPRVPARGCCECQWHNNGENAAVPIPARLLFGQWRLVSASHRVTLSGQRVSMKTTPNSEAIASWPRRSPPSMCFPRVV
jgi:hypothetical protein